MGIKNAKFYKLLGVIILVLLFLYSIFKALTSNPKPPAQSLPSAGAINIPTPSGPVQARDFTKTPIQQLGDSMLIAKTLDFEIVYFTKEQTFLVTVESQPVQKARDLAEQAFLDHLKIREADACRLQVSLFVPYNLSPDLSGKDYGLSFCPTGVSF